MDDSLLSRQKKWEGLVFFMGVIAFIKAIDDENLWAVTDIEGWFVEDDKDRKNDQSLRLISK